jgi:hypothetical protein
MRVKRPDGKLLLASLGIALGIVLVVIGVSTSVTGREEQHLPDAIEEIEPIRGATQVPQQSRIFVDLQAGYEAELTIDDVVLETISLDEVGGPSLTAPPDGQQLKLPPGAIYEPGNATISYTPVEGGPIEVLAPGLHTSTVTFWKAIEGRSHARTYTWQFTVV